MNKKKVYKCLEISALILIGGIVVLGVFIYNNTVMHFGEPVEHSINLDIDYDKILSEDEIHGDVLQLIEIVQDTHPIFIDGDLTEYEKAKLLANTKQDMSISEFQVEVSKYLSVFNDEHTVVRNYIFANKYLDIDWKYIDEKLMLIDENLKPTNLEVVSIGDRNTKDLIKEILEMFPSENYVGDIRNIENNLKSVLVLESLGFEVGKELEIELKSEEEEKKQLVSMTTTNRNNKDDRTRAYEKLNEDTLYIDFGTCVMDNMTEIINNTVSNELEKGTKNVIVDLRDNGGGNSQASDSLLQALGMEIGYFGSKIRFSDLAKEQRAYLRKDGHVEFEPSNEFKKNENVNLYVISNQNTFSSAQWLLTLVRDGDLGTIVGQAGFNEPSAFGDVLGFNLDNSGIELGISHKIFTRPDKSKLEENVLEPDIKIETWENPIDYILEDIKNKESD